MIRLPSAVENGSITPDSMRRLEGTLTQILDDLQRENQELRAALQVETDLARPPTRLGATAVVANEAYIAVGLTPADWKQVT